MEVHPQNSSFDVIHLADHSTGTGAYNNHPIARVNDHEIRISTMTGPFHWHCHPDSDEIFLALEGGLFIDFDDRTVELLPGQMITVNRGVRHRTQALPASRQPQPIHPPVRASSHPGPRNHASDLPRQAPASHSFSPGNNLRVAQKGSSNSYHRERFSSFATVPSILESGNLSVLDHWLRPSTQLNPAGRGIYQ